MPDLPEDARQPAFETPFEGAETVSAPSKDDAIPEEAVQAAADAMRARYVERYREPIKPVEEFEPDVRYIVEAAAPFIAARALIQERRRALRLVRRTLVPRGCEPTHDAAELIKALMGDLRV